MIRKTCFWITAVLMYCTVFSLLWDIINYIMDDARNFHISWLHKKFFGYSPIKYRITEDDYNYYIERKVIFSKWELQSIDVRICNYISKQETDALESIKDIYKNYVEAEKKNLLSKTRTVVKLPEDTPLYRTLND